MAIAGDPWVKEPTSVNQNDYLSIQPESGHCADLFYIFHAYPIKVFWYDGTNAIEWEGGDKAVLQGHCIPCTNTRYIRVQNTHTAAQYIGWTGKYTYPASE